MASLDPEEIDGNLDASRFSPANLTALRILPYDTALTTSEGAFRPASKCNT
jgi:hypothetical protein